MRLLILLTIMILATQSHKYIDTIDVYANDNRNVIRTLYLNEAEVISIEESQLSSVNPSHIKITYTLNNKKHTMHLPIDYLLIAKNGKYLANDYLK